MKRIIVFGGACIEGSPEKGFFTKAPIAKYLSDLSAYAEETHFFAQLLCRGDGEDRYTGALDAPGLKVRPLGRGLAERRKELSMLRDVAGSAGVILYMPNALFLFPLSRWLRAHSSAFAVYLANDFESHAREHRFKGGPIGRMIYLYSFRTMMRNAHFLISRGQRAALIGREYNERIHQTLPLGHLNLSEKQECVRRCADPARRHLLFVGKVLWRKGVGELLTALKLLVERRPDIDFDLTLVGDGSDREAAMARATDLGLSDKAHFSGWIDRREELEEYWRKADLLIMPSSLHKEGVPRVIDEALAQGLPVVATEIGGVGEEFAPGKEVLLVPPADAEALAKAIERMAFDASLRHEFVCRGMSRINRWRRYGSAGNQHGTLLAEVAEQRA